MKCYKGITLGTGAIVPCGQCMPCRINKGRLWSASILLEDAAPWLHRNSRGVRPYSYFLTLTYNDDNCPRTIEGVQTLRKRRFQKWLENAYRDFGVFRYYAVGEYGDNTMRPHYHMALFPNADSQVRQITERWEKTAGFTSCYELTPERARYCANYTTKKLTKDNDERLAENQEPEFRASSRVPPLGAAVIPSIVRAYSGGAGARLLSECGDIERIIRIGGQVYPLPRYILSKCRDKLGIPQTHSERLCHEGYFQFHHDQQIAEYQPEVAIQWEKRIVKTKKNRLNRNSTVNV